VRRDIAALAALLSCCLLLYPPWIWTAYSGTLSNSSKWFEEPIGIAYSPLWKKPDIKLYPHEYTLCASCEEIPFGATPGGIYLFFPLLLLEIGMVLLVSIGLNALLQSEQRTRSAASE
jgi:hypothetical protein